MFWSLAQGIGGIVFGIVIIWKKVSWVGGVILIGWGAVCLLSMTKASNTKAAEALTNIFFMFVGVVLALIFPLALLPVLLGFGLGLLFKIAGIVSNRIEKRKKQKEDDPWFM